MRVQIVSSRVGGGHQSVARALAEALGRVAGERATIWVDDLYVELARPPLGRFPWAYGVITRRYPRLWRLVFRLTNRPPGPGRLELLGDQMGGPRLGRLLADRRPDTVVSVLPGVNGFIARSLRRGAPGAPLEVVITDWADLHLSWVSAGVTHYTVPTDSAAATCRSAGVPGDRISVLGLPVREQFARAAPSPEAQRAARARLGLPLDRFILLATVGSEGSAGAVAHLRAVAATPLDAELIVLCGRSERLRRRIEALPTANPLRALGFVEEVADLMLAADLLVTKPGGVTLAEGFCCHVPVLAFDPLPGQEEGNARYVVARGAAELASTPRDFAARAAELRWSPARRAALAEGAAKLARPTAALDAAREIIRRAGVSGADAIP